MEGWFIFWSLREKITSWACLLRRGLKPLFHWNAQSFVFLKSLFTWVAELLALFTMGRGKKDPLPAFPLPHLCKTLNPCLVLVPNYWPWTNSTPSKKCFFRSNPYKIEFMITPLKEMLELSNFVHSNYLFESREKFLLLTS